MLVDIRVLYDKNYVSSSFSDNSVIRQVCIVCFPQYSGRFNTLVIVAIRVAFLQISISSALTMSFLLTPCTPS